MKNLLRGSPAEVAGNPPRTTPWEAAGLGFSGGKGEEWVLNGGPVVTQRMCCGYRQGTSG